jgi:hypothetical protein
VRGKKQSAGLQGYHPDHPEEESWLTMMYDVARVAMSGQEGRHRHKIRFPTIKDNVQAQVGMFKQWYPTSFAGISMFKLGSRYSCGVLSIVKAETCEISFQTMRLRV